MLSPDKNFKQFGMLTGAILGLGAPAGSILFRSVLAGRIDYIWISQDVHRHLFFYSYMMLLTPFVFGVFGAYLGNLNDKIRAQNKSLESMMHVLESQSMMDDVTGIYNHRHLMEEIEKEVERSKRYNHVLSGMMVDVDGFKNINELYGHPVGNYILREMALVLRQSIRKIDIIGRYGGDEFIAILPEADLKSSEVVSKRILQNVRQHRFKTARDYISLTVSIGLFSFEDASTLDAAQFIEKIDQNMFQAKRSGKDTFFAMP